MNKQIRVSENLYARIKSKNQDDETVDETLERMVSGYGPTDFVRDMAEIHFDGSMREVIERAVDAPTPPGHG